MLKKHRKCLKKQKEAVKHRLTKLAARQSEIAVSCSEQSFLSVCLVTQWGWSEASTDGCLCLIQKRSSVIRQSIIQKYQEIQAALDEDLRITLSHLEMEERAAVSALDMLMERNCSLIQEIEQDLARLAVVLNQTDTAPDAMVIKLDNCNVKGLNLALDCD